MRSTATTRASRLLIALASCVAAACAAGPTAPEDLTGRERDTALYAQGTWEYVTEPSPSCAFLPPSWAVEADGPPRQRFRCGEIVVRFSAATSTSDASALALAAGTALVSHISSPSSGLLVLVQCPARDEQAALDRLYRLRDVTHAFPNFEVVVE